MRDAASCVTSPRWRPRAACREANGFSWGPIKEVAILFAAIFTTMIPVLAMLRAGATGRSRRCWRSSSTPDGGDNTVAYFWLTGVLSRFLDNAPTYLVFFDLAGGDPQHLMTQGALTSPPSPAARCSWARTAISATRRTSWCRRSARGGIKMPSFFGYMLWSGGILVPLFVLNTWLWFL